MLRKRLILSALLLFMLSYTSVVFSQGNGTITGKVVDKETGTPLPGVNVVIEGTRRGSATDLEGVYRIKGLPAGTYSLVSTYIGYSNFRIEGVEVNEGQVEKLDFAMGMEVLEGQEVVVTAKAVKNTEAVLLKDRQKATSVSDAISAEAITQAGAGDAAEAMKGVTGASVVGGKKVFVRGLGDRYTSTQLNGAELPSSDPYARSGSIDLIPSGLIDNIVTVKSFTPDKAGDFSGGTVDIKTKDFPEQLTLNFSASTSYNTQATFNDNALRVTDAGNLRWLGFDNGSLSLPGIVGNDLLTFEGNPRTNSELAQFQDVIVKSFNHNMMPNTATLPMAQSYSFSAGNQFELFGKPFGYLGSLTYSRSYKNYDDGEYNRWGLDVLDPSKASGLDMWYDLNDHKTTDDVLWGATLKTSYKPTSRDLISVTGLYNQNAVATSRIFSGIFPYDYAKDDTYIATAQQYNERSLRSVHIDGSHQLDAFWGIKADWKIATSRTTQDEPDTRYLNFYQNANGLIGIRSNTAQERYYRNLEEDRNDYKLDFTVPMNFAFMRTGSLKFGYSYSTRQRDFLERRFVYDPNSDLQDRFRINQDDLNSTLTSDVLGLIGQETRTLPNGEIRTYNTMGIILEETAQQSSNYDAEQVVDATYAMVDVPVTRKLRFIGGARYESTDMFVNSLDPDPQYSGAIETHDLLPSVNFVYSLSENMNARVAYGRTLARPSFREISGFASYDFKEGDKFRGYSNLKRTLIDNFDLRWEWFSRPGEIYAISAFYKDFTDPIVQVLLKGGNSWFSWRNVAEATTYGVEFEMRKKLDVLHHALNNFTFSGNLSLIESEIQYTNKDLLDEYQQQSDTSAVVNYTRPFQGQSPYLLNLSLAYDNYDRGLNASLYLNIFGQRLSSIGEYPTPDIYEQPATILNFSITKKLINHMSVKLAVNNILDTYEKRTYEFKDTEYIYQRFQTGRTFSMGFKYNL